MKQFSDFTNLFSVAKTLRFELKPDARTLKHIEANGFLEEDAHRADSYQKVKKIIDRYHKAYIDCSLEQFKNVCIEQGKTDGGKNVFDDLLEKYYLLYSMKGSKDEKLKKEFDDIHKKLRESIVKALKADEKFSRIDKEKLITEDLPSFIENEEEHKLIEEFYGFTTYFTGFNENRQNMYSSEVQSTAIAYRLIHENLPKFIDNMEVFAKIAASPLCEKFITIINDMEPYLNVIDIREMFQLDYFKYVLTQSGIDVYNSVIGGRTENDIKIQGLNEYINLYNQQQNNKQNRLPKLKPLYKQILSDRNSISWIPEEFKSDTALLKAVKSCYDFLNDNILKNGGDNKSLKELLCNIGDYDLNRIWIANDLQLTEISQKLFGNWNAIEKSVKESLRTSIVRSRRDTEESYSKKIDDAFKRFDSFSIAYLNNCIESTGKCIEEHFIGLGAIDDGIRQTESLLAQIKNAYSTASVLLENQCPSNYNLIQDKEAVTKLKSLLDTIKELQHFIKPLLGKGNEAEKDGKFYGDFTAIWEILDSITPLYNMVRNYVTRKPYSEEKIKLNFSNSNLLSGWDVNKEPDNLGIILKKGEEFFLGIMDKNNSRSFKQDFPTDGECYEKMIYKQIALPMGVGAFVRKCFGSAQQYGWTCPESCMTGDKIIIQDDEASQNLVEIIDCYKDFFAKYEKDGFKYSNYGFEFKDSAKYTKLSEFFQDVKEQGFLLQFKKVSVSYIDTLVEEGKLYLFQIYNKDFSQFSKGTPNMHTLYWRMLFDKENLKDVVYKLSGGAEVFYRKSSLKCEKPTHPAGQPIANKNVLNPKKTSVFEYDLIKDRRYTVDKFQFHVPITMNFKAIGKDRINAEVNEYIRNKDGMYFIGIDRGERHLLYVCVIDSKGNIVEQYSLNEIVEEYNGVKHRTNYHDLLDTRGESRDKARKSWLTIEKIKDLKEGYLSQVIHKITDLMVKYQAPVILEDLNIGFKRGRQKVESSVYQQFEKQLIDKLNYLVNKRTPITDTGGLLHALQLTSKVGSFREMGKQCGFLFYIPAWNTSKMDPVTGFVNLFDTHYETVDKSRAFFSKFDSIRYNASNNWFEFAFDYDKFTEKAEGTRTKWTLCTHGTRVITFRNPEKNSSWDSVEVNLTDEFKKFFAENGIDINGNLKAQIAESDNKPFFERLLNLLKLTLQMRNSITGTDVDYLISPVADENGHFYDSRTCGDKLPANADANGAYNIARKGLWVAQQIRESSDDKVKLAISNKEWLSFAQAKPYLK